MSKTTKGAEKQPPHSLQLRAHQRSMPNTPGVHVHTSEVVSDEPGTVGSEKELSEGSEISPRLAEICAAIDKVALDDESAWTKAKGPRVAALEAVLGYEITEAERDAAWALNLEN